MSELREILREEYIKQVNQLDLKTLLEMVEDALDSPMPITEEGAPTIGAEVSDKETLEMILKMIPNIEVSEIGWSDVSTVGEGEEQKTISGPQRQLLEGYLKNIDGKTFEERIANISRFYSDGAGIIGESKKDGRTEKITQAISYLVFYKTLTKVITNFNASSAGFSFESFLSALVKGKQIQTGNKTIADYTDGLSGQEIPVSLKLYREGGLEVGGSYTDLINDLVEPKFVNDTIGGGMRYVICTKDLKGKDLEQEGSIKLWQFDFTLDNVMWILMNSQQKSAECIRLPQQAVGVIQGKGAERSDHSNMLNLPLKAALPSSEKLHTDIFIPKLKGQIGLSQQQKATKSGERLIKFLFRSDQELSELVSSLNWDSNDDLFKDVVVKIKHGDVTQEENLGKIRGRARMHRDVLTKFVVGWVEALVGDLKTNPEKNTPLHDYLRSIKEDARGTLLRQLAADVGNAIFWANQGTTKHKKEEKPKDYSPMTDVNAGVLATQRASEIEAERKVMIQGILDAEGGFLSPSASAQVYNQTKNPEFKKALLKHSLGYLASMHFSMNQTQATNGEQPAGDREEPAPTTKNSRNTKTVSGGTGAIELGEIKVGAKYVAQAMAGVREILNEEILQIFQALKILSDSLNKFFAGGLKDDTLASDATTNAYNIGGKEVLRPSSSDTPGGPRPHATRTYDASGFNEAKNTSAKE